MYEEWRPIPGFPRYEVNRQGDIRYVETKVHMAPSMQDSHDSYYPLILEDHTIRLLPMSKILDMTYPKN